MASTRASDSEFTNWEAEDEDREQLRSSDDEGDEDDLHEAPSGRTHDSAPRGPLFRMNEIRFTGTDAKSRTSRR